jgi:hypothetical protein
MTINDVLKNYDEREKKQPMEKEGTEDNYEEEEVVKPRQRRVQKVVLTKQKRGAGKPPKIDLEKTVYQQKDKKKKKKKIKKPIELSKIKLTNEDYVDPDDADVEDNISSIF